MPGVVKFSHQEFITPENSFDEQGETTVVPIPPLPNTQFTSTSVDNDNLGFESTSDGSTSGNESGSNSDDQSLDSVQISETQTDHVQLSPQSDSEYMLHDAQDHSQDAVSDLSTPAVTPLIFVNGQPHDNVDLPGGNTPFLHSGGFVGPAIPNPTDNYISLMTTGQLNHLVQVPQVSPLASNPGQFGLSTQMPNSLSPLMQLNQQINQSLPIPSAVPIPLPVNLQLPTASQTPVLPAPGGFNPMNVVTDPELSVGLQLPPDLTGVQGDQYPSVTTVVKKSKKKEQKLQKRISKIDDSQDTVDALDSYAQPLSNPGVKKIKKEKKRFKDQISEVHDPFDPSQKDKPNLVFTSRGKMKQNLTNEINDPQPSTSTGRRSKEGVMSMVRMFTEDSDESFASMESESEANSDFSSSLEDDFLQDIGEEFTDIRGKDNGEKVKIRPHTKPPIPVKPTIIGGKKDPQVEVDLNTAAPEGRKIRKDSKRGKKGDTKSRLNQPSARYFSGQDQKDLVAKLDLSRTMKEIQLKPAEQLQQDHNNINLNIEEKETKYKHISDQYMKENIRQNRLEGNTNTNDSPTENGKQIPPAPKLRPSTTIPKIVTPDISSVALVQDKPSITRQDLNGNRMHDSGAKSGEYPPAVYKKQCEPDKNVVQTAPNEKSKGVAVDNIKVEVPITQQDIPNEKRRQEVMEDAEIQLEGLNEPGQAIEAGTETVQPEDVTGKTDQGNCSMPVNVLKPRGHPVQEHTPDQFKCPVPDVPPLSVPVSVDSSVVSPVPGQSSGTTSVPDLVHAPAPSPVHASASVSVPINASDADAALADAPNPNTGHISPSPSLHSAPGISEDENAEAGHDVNSTPKDNDSEKVVKSKTAQSYREDTLNACSKERINESVVSTVSEPNQSENLPLRENLSKSDGSSVSVMDMCSDTVECVMGAGEEEVGVRKMAASAMSRAAEAEEGVEDMIKLSDLNEDTILKNLKVRYDKNKIYTYVGSILVAVNPYRMFSIYGLDMVKKYEGQALGDLPPHLFAVGSTSYCKMIKDKENQVIVISGESGAGKTESTKLIMQYLAAVNKSRHNLITEQILEANPLLESFGNAKTIRNDNSSRFGKYIEVFFKDGSIVGARTLEYLLEKSRIVTQAPEERNYHVFYEMLESMSDEHKSKYGLQTAPKYFYLNQGGSSVIPGRDDAENFRKLTSAMEILSFQKPEKETIYKILASVLHIGNVYFHTLLIDNHDTVQLGSDAELKWVSYLLGLSEEWLKQALTSKITEARGERVVSPYNMDQALDARDAMSKALYSRLFTWLVERINQIICKAEREKSTSLAVLDIFGFEDFHTNSFEQLCINFANETLQFFFNQHVFKLEQKEYQKEKIRWQHIDFRDNQPTIDLISSKPAGILHILDDESNFPKATDASFLEKCHFHHGQNSLYEKPRMSDPEFYIMHYAGKIKYNVQHFLEKNKDTLRSDVVELMCESKNKIIAQMFKELRDRLITKTLSKTTGRYVTLKPQKSTVAASFNESLVSLIDTMSRCNPYFVRCIKPNVTKAAMVFEDNVVMEQLRYSGMLETIRIRKLGYPIRIKFTQFIERYRCLIQGPYFPNRHLPSDVCGKILESQGPRFANQYQVGTSKVFMKETFEQQLDVEATKIQSGAALQIQTMVRTFLARKRFLRTQASTRKIQKMVRMAVQRKKFKVIRNGIIKAQAQFRMYRQRLRYLQAREQIRQKLELERQARKKQEARVKMEREKRPGREITRRISLLFPVPNVKILTDEEKEREARAVASVSNLEIPGELAFVYNKLDDWRLPHTGTNINVVPDVKPLDMGYRLPVDINSHAFSKYVGAYFKKSDWGVEIQPIKIPLTNVQGGDLSHRALSVFKLILRFMMEQNMSEKKQKVLSDYIVQMGLQNEGLRDEILCQLTNQTWQNQNVGQAEKAWLLLAMCLSCFSPSSTLFKYILKYVSDIGLNGYKSVCQHKVLQSANISPELCRVYPPCFLEWVAAQRKANMALEVKFPDDRTFVGHVESWTSGELFTSHLLKERGLAENAHGWTVVLQEDLDYYELMGYDYVLDLISEVELAPGFPVCKAYFLVSSDRSQERVSQRRHAQTDSPHNPDRDRIMVILGPLPAMIKREYTQPATGNVADLNKLRNTERKTSDRTIITERKTVIESGSPDNYNFSMTSVLNQRPTEIFDSLSDSRLNVRYNKRRAPGPPLMNGHVSNGITNGEITTILEVDSELDLSDNRLNNRYLGQNGDAHPVAETNGDLSSSKLNTRYVKSSKVNNPRPKSGVADQINRRERRDTEVISDNASVATGHSDWSHWVEDVFSNALNEHVDGLSESRSVENRLKGGGKGIPGLTTPQQTPVTPVGQFGFGIPPVAPQLSPNLGLGVGIGATDPVQQLIAQQALAQQQAQAQQQQQQQAVLQAYLQAQRQQEQQQQQQQAILQAALQQQQQPAMSQQQQTSALRAALQQQELQNKLLKQSIEQEILKAQLQQIQVSPTQVISPAVVQQVPAVNVVSPGAYNPETGQPITSNQFPVQRNRVYGQSSASPGSQPPPVGAKKVSFIKDAFEGHSSQPKQPKRYTVTTRQTNGQSVIVGFDSDANQQQEEQQQQVQQQQQQQIQQPQQQVQQPQAPPVSPPSHPPPPPPPEQFADAKSPSFTVQHQPSIPPPPPPPPPPPIVSSNDKTKTIRIRVGNIVWPPIKDPEEKHEREVGKLMIDEKVTSDLNNRFGGKKTHHKPFTPKDETKPKSILKKTDEEDEKPPVRRTKSLVESHGSTMKLLESKLGGGGKKEEPKMKTTEGTQTSDTLKSSKTIATTVPPPPPPPPPTADVAPPLPSRPPPKRKVTADITTTITQTTTKTMEVSSRTSPTYSTKIEPDEPPKQLINYTALEKAITELYPQNKTFFLMYNRVPWTLNVRKEVFWPQERLEKPLALHLLFCQIVKDVYNSGCVRITKEERVKMKSHLESQGITENNYITKEVSNQVKKIIIDTAKEWPCYFCRLFPVASTGHYTGVKYLGVSHSGLRLVTRERSYMEDHLSVIEEIRFEDVVDTMMPSSTTMQLNLKSKSIMFYTPRALQMKNMVDKFCHESDKDNKYAVAIKDYVTRESTLLSFRRGDIIKLMDPEMNLDEGWLYGSLNGIVGMLPAEYVKPLARHEVETNNMKVSLARPPSRDGHVADDRSDTSQGTVLADGKYSMMEFALLNFRESIDKYEMQRTDEGSIRGTIKMIESLKLRNLQQHQRHQRRGSSEWTWREQAELVKWTRSPIQASLLKLQSSELNKLALECFINIMMFMEDYPKQRGITDYECVMRILRCCHKYPELRDEVFCQLCKQTTSNRSMKHRSAIRGWRLFALIAAFCDCSEMLRPYLFKYLETTASDTTRHYSNAAALCLQNLRKTFKFGGRKNTPLREEVQALADGRNSKRFPFIYSGTDTQGGMLQVKSCTIVLDAIDFICRGLNIFDLIEMEEYTLFLRTRDGSFNKLSREEYILDVTAQFVREKKDFDLIFQRTVWFFPLSHMDNDIYIDMMFNQCILDYLDGLLVINRNAMSREQQEQISQMGALLYKAQNNVGLPTMKDLDITIPRTVRQHPEVRPQQWLNRVHEHMRGILQKTPLDCRVLFLEFLSRWPLFGSTFFLIKSVPNVTGECMLAVNSEGIQFLKKDTHETILKHPFSEILSTRRYRSDYNVNYLDMKLGNLMVQKILRIETDQGSDISNLIGQYMQVINRYRKRPDRPSNGIYN